MDENSLNRFLKAQELDYQTALTEVKNGRKTTHWIWYIFPQIDGLGKSYTAKYYSIHDLNEAKLYLENPTLCERLLEISNALLNLDIDNPIKIFGYTDAVKVKSCMTLFEVANPKYEVFGKVLDKFYNGNRDKLTLDILKNQDSN